MKKNYSIAAALLLFHVVCFGQSNHLIDSLEDQLSKTIHDTTRVRALIKLADAYTFTDFQKSTQYAKEAIDLAIKTEIPSLKYSANQQLALSYSLEGDYTSALKYETICLQLALLLNDSTNIGLSHSNVGNYYYEIGEYDEAYYYLTQAYKILQRFSKNSNDSLYMNIALHNVGRVFKELGQYEVALKHLRLSQKISEKIGDAEGKPYSLDEIGDVELRLGEYDSALHYLKLSLLEGKKIIASNSLTSIKELQPKTYSKIAKAYLHKGDFDKTFAYYDSTYMIHELTGNKLGIAEAELGRGIAFIKQGKFEEAMRYIEKSVALAKEINARVLEISCYEQLSTLWEKKGDYKKSLEYFKQYKVLGDSLFSNEMQQKLLRDQIGFETATRDDQIAALTRVEEIQKSELRKTEFIRNILVVVVALTAILLFTVYRSGQRRKQINALLLQHQDEMEKRSKELEQLNEVKDKFFSIISHDLRSPINALAGLMDLLDKGAVASNELPAAIKELRIRFNHTRSLMNNLLDWTVLQMDKMNLQAGNIQLHKLAEENIELMGSIQTKKIKMVNNVPANAVGYGDSNTINLVIRNLMTNAVKFTNDGGEITLAAESKGNDWVLSVRDNGIGMSADIQKKLFDKINPYSTRGTANEKGTGLGLILCKEFVEKNGGRIWVESKENEGSTFWFTVPKAS
ncbi:MAG TPA: tetratricopeptide repeat protein [Cyclobacteriaceae bacterium]|nr:tetratricopeptide repeat protein [Cyclobacteriaceae bacterium]